VGQLSIEELIRKSVSPGFTTLQPEGVGQLSIEEGFARFSILQGVTSQLKQFGYNFFDVQFSGFPPVMDTPVGPDYVLGPDDTLALHVWNVPDPSFNRSYISPVERDGTIFVPQVGSIPVAGSTFSQATRLIHARLSSLLKRFELHVSMARLRTIKVYVVGEVVRPGAYEISSLATASHALYAACGPTKAGSLRRIQVVREGKVVSELDFYQFFLRGDRTHDIRLHGGDTLVVPPIGPVAAIGGPVKRPSIYELKDRSRLTELIDLAGGLTPTADRTRCQIFRVEAGLHRVILDIDLERALAEQSGVQADVQADVQATASRSTDKGDPPIQDGDFVRITAVPTQIENAVSLAGAVRNPGPFEFRAGMRLKDLLTPEQMLVDSYFDRAELVRTDPVTYETTVQAFSPRKLFQGKEENVELRRLDKVLVATQVRPPRVVSVMGEVKRPGQYTIESGERLSSLLKRAGGFTPRAFPQGIMVVRESVRRSQQMEIQRFVTVQKQKFMSEAAALASGAAGVPGSTVAQEQATLQIQMQALDQLALMLQPGRIVVKMDSLEQLEGSLDDIMLEEADQITMPQRPQTVNIVGAVRTPTSVIYREGVGTKEYIEQAGGVTPDARQKETYILRANGSTEGAYAQLKTIGPGDTIVVPERIEPKTRPLPLWQAIAGIVSSLAMVGMSVAIISTIR
jgi:protein involved in polysaccharide export with SLBB domain